MYNIKKEWAGPAGKLFSVDRTNFLKSFICCTSSALLLAGSYNTQYGCGGIFCFLIPLFYVTLHRPISFIHGVWWGAVFYSIHWFGIAVLVAEYGQGILKIPLFILMLCYMIIHAGIWFLLASFLSRLIYPGIAWISITICYFYYIEYGVLWIFGRWSGYCFSSFLIPMAHISLLHAVVDMGALGITSMVISFSYSIAYGLYRKNIWYVAVPIGIYIIMSLLYTQTERERIPDYVKYLGYIQPRIASEICLFDQVQQISRSIRLLIKKYPKTRLILLPESALPCMLNQHPDYITMLRADDCIICVGSHRSSNKGTGSYNSVYFLQDGRITLTYDKIFLFPLTEQLPFFITNNSHFDVFLKNTILFQPGSSIQNNSIQLWCGTASCALCSDLFCHAQHMQLTGEIIIWLVNDSWFSVKYLRHLMEKTAIVRAVTLQKEIIYVSYEKACWISKHGTSTIINS